ncbi:1401_t:CDS:2, partial [Gigaspora rosea]
WKCIIGDLDQGQTKGLGLALANIEPKFTWNWVEFYSNDWVLASLNPVFSKIPIDIWYSTSHDTNVSESSHARVNRYGINLNLYKAIQKGFLEDKRTFHSIKHIKFQEFLVLVIDRVNKKRVSTSKPKSAKKQKTTTKQINIQETDHTKSLEDIEITERRLAVKEKEIALKERETELELKKLQIEKMKKELN